MSCYKEEVINCISMIYGIIFVKEQKVCSRRCYLMASSRITFNSCTNSYSNSFNKNNLGACWWSRFQNRVRLLGFVCPTILSSNFRKKKIMSKSNIFIVKRNQTSYSKKNKWTTPTLSFSLVKEKKIQKKKRLGISCSSYITWLPIAIARYHCFAGTLW